MNDDRLLPLNMSTIMVVICFLLVNVSCSQRSLHTTSHAQKGTKSMTDSSELDATTKGERHAAYRDSTDGGLNLGNSEETNNVFQDEELVSGEDSAVKDIAPFNPGQRHWETRRMAEVVTAEAGLLDVFFEFDSWRLTDKAKRILASNAEWLKTHPDDQLTIEGHCDERGTHAYNYALGEKRATMARNYMAALGVSPSQMGIVSYGKDNPSCTILTEACFNQNRRAHLVLGISVAANMP